MSSQQHQAPDHTQSHGDHGHADHGHGHDHIHAPPTSFLRKYVFSIDHKVIGIQFTFASLLFVIVGGLLALGVRYQIAWPQQDVPYAKLLPDSMILPAPEANVALWEVGDKVKFLADTEVDGVKIAAGTEAKLNDFPEGFAVELPVGTIIESSSGRSRTLTAPARGYVDRYDVMASYQYARQEVLASVGIPVRLTGEGAEEVTIAGYEIIAPGDIARISTDPVVLPLIRNETQAALTVTTEDGKTANVVVSAGTVDFTKNTLTTDAYLTLFTMHASIMIFFVIIPMLVGGFGNFLIPLMIGARDMAFPKLNMAAFWFTLPFGALMVGSFFVPGGASGGGWTMYPPLSGLASDGTGFTAQQLGTTIWVFSVAFLGFSSIMGALNYITTVVNMRAPGMTMFRMPLTVWTIFITAILQLFATPVLTAAMFLLLSDRVFGTQFFIPESGGQPLLWQHLFWFYSHPAVYIMILPAMGVVSDVIAVHSRKPIFGYKPMIFSTMAIAGLGFIVWGHHMFQSGMNPVLGTTFMASTIMIALPSAIKTFNWLGTIWSGDIRFTPAMLNAMGFVSMFVIGGLSGIFMASAPVDIPMHDTYFIVAHIHYVLFGGSIFGIFAGIYHWYPKMFGRQMDQRWGTIHFIMTFIGFNGTFFLMHVLGIGGHPRRYASIMEFPTLQHLQPMNVVMTIFAMMMGMGQLVFFWNFFASLPSRLAKWMIGIACFILGGPMLLGNAWYSDALAESSNFVATLALIGVALVYVVVITVGVNVLWILGKAGLRALVCKLLWIAFVPLFLAPALLKHDFYVMLDIPGLFAARWWLLVLSAVPATVYLVMAKPKDAYGAATTENPWNATSLEWATSSPPAHHNFDVIPTVYRGPYEYSSPVVQEDYLPQDKVLPPGVVEPTGH